MDRFCGTILVFILLWGSAWLPHTGFCQGFNIRETYERYMQTHHMAVLCEGDSIVVFGTTVNTNPPYAWRGFVAKKDTWGETSQMKIFYDDSLGLDMYIVIGSPVTRLHSGRYAVTGYVNVGEKPFFLLLNDDFNIKRFIVLPNPPPNMQPSPYYIGTHIIESMLPSRDIYICGDYKSTQSGRSVPFLARLDSLGNVVFVKQYEMGGMWGNPSDMIFQQENTITIVGRKSSILGFSGHSEAELGYNYGFFLSVDTAGTLISFTQEGGGGCFSQYVTGICEDNQNNRYISYNTKIPNTYSPMYQRCATNLLLKKQDSAGNELWTLQLTDSTYTWWDALKVKEELNNGDLLLVGGSIQYENMPFYDSIGCQTLGRLLRVSPQGEIRWDRYFYQPTDTCINSNSIFNFLYSTAEDAQGNLYAAGMSEDPNFAPQQQGWLVKVDADGCMQPGCNLGVGNDDGSGLAGYVYPNPATDGFWYYSPEELPGKTEFTLYGLNGKMHRKHTAYTLPAGTYVRFEVAGLPPGMYALAVENSGKRAVYKILVGR